MEKLKRNDRINLFRIGANKFEGRNREDDVVLDSDSNYSIYLKNVNFKNGNLIQGTYLGEKNIEHNYLDSQYENSPPIVIIDKNDFTCNNNLIKTARMVTISNGAEVIVDVK